MRAPSKRVVFAIFALSIPVLCFAWRSSRTRGVESAAAAPTEVVEEESPTRRATMADVLEMARAARSHMSKNLDDYTARLVKREVDTSGNLGGETEMLLKVQTRFRGDTETAPMRVYLQFTSPESVQGREVLWGEDLGDGKMAVHEPTFPLNLKTIWLDPNGFFAMQGQRYPISEIGLVRLVEKLLERGEQDRDNPDIHVTITTDHYHGDVRAELIQVRRDKPGGGNDDFSLAEIVIDPDRHLILMYRSFGWPEQQDAAPPLLESYTYHDVKTNVGLARSDFDPENSNYSFP